MDKTKEEVAEILGAFFTICSAIVTEDSSNYQKHIPKYLFARKGVLDLENQLTIPNWILCATEIPFLKSHVDLNVQGGPGSWSRRRAYLHSAMNTILDSYSNALTKSMAGAFRMAHQDDSSYINGNEMLGNYQSSDNTAKYQGQTHGAISHPLSQPNDANIRYEQEKLGMSNAGSPTIQIKPKVFIVHGHDEKLKNEVYVFLNQEGFDPIILHHQANKGATIIDKLKEHIETVSFAVVLYTACDEGRSIKQDDLKSRARQNVVFEHGYLLCKLGTHRVAALKSDGVEIPGDLSGLITIPTINWQYELQKELKILR